MDEKIIEAQEILKGFGLPEAQQNRISALTLLALSGITPVNDWESATSKSLTLSKDIIEFANYHYKAGYKPNTRESFRKNALKPFVENNITLLNPDNPNLSPNSSKTHYALTELALNVIRTYRTKEWQNALNEFKKNQFIQNLPSDVLLGKLSIRNYKSIFDDSLDLGRFNVLIGANGCGKSNILEAIAFAGASLANDLNFEGLYSRGVRIARPDLTISSFLSTPQKKTIDFSVLFRSFEIDIENYNLSLYPENPTDIYTKWRDSNDKESLEALIEIYKSRIINSHGEESPADLMAKIFEIIDNSQLRKDPYLSLISNYAIFDLNTKSLRGVVPTDSRKTPLGINGEGLDLLIANFNSYEKDYLKECSIFFDWLDSIFNDKNDRAKMGGLKAGRSSSTLYFVDKYMQKQNNTFSAENSNEGILHILFYISLFISNKTPNLFAIDNIETALNPRLCQKLIPLLVKLSKERGKQALITTHNPAILDGLNLLDDDQRLFEVSRDSEGKTRIRRIKFKNDLSDKKYKLSEMWMKGLLGAVPNNF